MGAGDISKAKERFHEALRIDERLAATDRANAEWQRSLSVAHWKLACVAQQQGDGVALREHSIKCLGVLETMKRCGMEFDSQMEEVHRFLMHRLRTGLL